MIHAIKETDSDKTFSVSDALKLPFLIVERTNFSSLEPSIDTMKMESMITNTPCNRAFI